MRPVIVQAAGAALLVIGIGAFSLVVGVIAAGITLIIAAEVMERAE